MERLKKLPLRTHWIIHLLSIIVGGFIGLVSSQFNVYVNIGMIVGFVLIIFSFVWQIIFLKCPHCGYRFHLRRPVSSHCPNCGEKISRK